MKQNSRIRFNPVTKEIEIEGSELFVKTYFNKLQAMLSGSPEKTVVTKENTKAEKAPPLEKIEKKPRATSTRRTRKIGKVTNIDKVVSLIQKSPEGISTSELKDKTGLAESQIWNIVSRAAKDGKIKKVRMGLYGAAS
jgi:hypothetical protein